MCFYSNATNNLFELITNEIHFMHFALCLRIDDMYANNKFCFCLFAFRCGAVRKWDNTIDCLPFNVGELIFYFDIVRLGRIIKIAINGKLFAKILFLYPQHSLNGLFACASMSKNTSN